MADLGALAKIPGYGAYVARTQMNEQQGLQDMQQASALLNLQQQMRAQQQDSKLRQTLSGGASIEDALEAAIKSGNLGVAAKLAPIVEARRKGQPIGSGGLMKPDGTIVPPAARPVQPPAPPQLVQLITTRDALPQGHPNRAILDKAIEKLSTHQAPVNVYSGSLTAGVDAEGNPVFVQPSGQPGVAPRIVRGVRPPPKDATQKLPAEIQRMTIGLNSLESGLDAYEKLLEDFNPRNPMDQMSPANRARATSLVADLQMQAKEAQALGALTGPDIEILDRLLKNPVSFAGVYFGTGGLKEQLKQSREAIKRRRGAIDKQFAGSQPPSAEAPKTVNFGDLK
jgi:hypothetical protein